MTFLLAVPTSGSKCSSAATSPSASISMLGARECLGPVVCLARSHSASWLNPRQQFQGQTGPAMLRLPLTKLSELPEAKPRATHGTHGIGHSNNSKETGPYLHMPPLC